MYLIKIKQNVHITLRIELSKITFPKIAYFTTFVDKTYYK